MNDMISNEEFLRRIRHEEYTMFHLHGKKVAEPYTEMRRKAEELVGTTNAIESTDTVVRSSDGTVIA